MPNERDLSLREEIYGAAATTTIPDPPVPGQFYRDETVEPEVWSEGQYYGLRVSAAEWNQRMYTWTKLLNYIEKYGIMPYSAETDYELSAYCLGLDGEVKEALKVNGPNTDNGAHDTTDVEYWKDAFPDLRDELSGHITATTGIHAAQSEALNGQSRIIIRDAEGRAQVSTPADPTDIVTKELVDELGSRQIIAESPITGGGRFDDPTLHLSAAATVEPTSNNMALRAATGRSQIIDPVLDDQIATLGYIKETIKGGEVPTSLKITVTAPLTIDGVSGGTADLSANRSIGIPYNVNASAGTVPTYAANYRPKINDPVDSEDYATKKYVDDVFSSDGSFVPFDRTFTFQQGFSGGGYVRTLESDFTFTAQETASEVNRCTPRFATASEVQQRSTDLVAVSLKNFVTDLQLPVASNTNAYGVMRVGTEADTGGSSGPRVFPNNVHVPMSAVYLQNFLGCSEEWVGFTRFWSGALAGSDTKIAFDPEWWWRFGQQTARRIGFVAGVQMSSNGTIEWRHNVSSVTASSGVTYAQINFSPSLRTANHLTFFMPTPGHQTNYMNSVLTYQQATATSYVRLQKAFTSDTFLAGTYMTFMRPT